MTQRFSITGKVGEKVEVKVDQDSERLFDFENSIMLTYTGNENEIIKKVEAGNVSLNMSGPQRATISGKNKGLFGLKTEAQIGNLNLTGIASLERGQKNRKSPHQESKKPPFTEKEFIRDQYFWFNKDEVDVWGDPITLPNYRDSYRHYTGGRSHVAPAGSRILDVQVYVSTGASQNEDTPLRGTAVPITFLQYFNGEPIPGSLPDSVSIDSVSGDWRQMNDYEYDVDKQLGTIRFKQRTPDTEAIAFTLILEDGTKYGTYGSATDTENPIDPDNLQLILLRTKSPHPDDETWELMFRHVYSLGGQGISPDDFKIEIIRKASSSNFDENGPPGSDDTYLTVFGFDLTGESGGTPDGKIDDVPARIIDYAFGEIHFLDLTPFNPSGYYLDNIVDTTSILYQFEALPDAAELWFRLFECGYL